MTDDIIDADGEWPETQTGGEDSECDPILDADGEWPETQTGGEDSECMFCGEEFGTKQAAVSHEGQEHSDRGSLRPVPFAINHQGYEVWYGYHQQTPEFVRVHQLLAIADGADPHEVFADDTILHHGPKIEHPRGNIPGNIQVMGRGEHVRHHQQIADEELLDELRRLADRIGRVPRHKDMRDHSLYGSTTYRRHFGSWAKAKEAAFAGEPRPATLDEFDD